MHPTSRSARRNAVRPTLPGRWSLLPGMSALLVLMLAMPGCDRDSGKQDMVLQPSRTSPARTTTTAPTTLPAAEPDEAPVPPVAYISIDGEPHEFPPAKLWLTQRDGRVRANLFSDDPPEALQANWDGLGFWFEMELDLGADAEPIPPGPVSPDLLSGAEWVFQSRTSERTDTSSGIFLGAKRQLQPMDVAVSFDPLDDQYVIVTLYGTFGQFDRDDARGAVAQKRVLIQAVLSARMVSN